ncbi:MAG: hypothetical protein HXL38_03285 [Candidatus Saccharimonas sp.]|nr:MAG: hypothetical protein HXL38_03285 [Candidatus Saccharimonas sp.]
MKAVRCEISKKLGREIAILQDLQGPKIRLGDIVDNRFEVNEGDELVLDYAPATYMVRLICQFNTIWLKRLKLVSLFIFSMLQKSSNRSY